MSLKERTERTSRESTTTSKKRKKQWRTATLENVSGKVMAQPYIRFT